MKNAELLNVMAELWLYAQNLRLTNKDKVSNKNVYNTFIINKIENYHYFLAAKIESGD